VCLHSWALSVKVWIGNGGKYWCNKTVFLNSKHWWLHKERCCSREHSCIVFVTLHIWSGMLMCKLSWPRF
jgi:hypothetical protein